MLFNNRRRTAPTMALTAPSTSSPESFDFVHTEPLALMNQSLEPTSEAGQVHEITLQQTIATTHGKARSSSSIVNHDAVKLSYTKSGESFPLRVQTCFTPNALAGGSKMVLRNEQNEPCAVVLKNTSSFRIYGFEPYMSSQHASTSCRYDDGQPMFLWGTVSIGNSSNSRHHKRATAARGKNPEEDASFFTLGMVNGKKYLAHRRAAAATTKRGLGRRRHLDAYQVVCESTPSHSAIAFPQCATFQPTSRHSWNVKVGPGVDPGLMIAFCTIIGQMIQ